MSDQFKNKMDNEEAVAETLKSVARKIDANPMFKDELERRLMETHTPANAGLTFPAFKRALPAIGWIVTLAAMTLFLNWIIRSLIPMPMPAANETSSPPAEQTPSPIPTENATRTPSDDGYDWRGTTLDLAQPLPESPGEANVHLLKLNQPVTIDEALALAQRFGIQGEAQKMPSEIPGTLDYMITDGEQRLQVRSDHYFTYHSDFENFTLGKLSEEQAQIVIDSFLKQHGFDFEYRLETAAQMAGQQYYILPLTADGHEMRFDYMMPVRYEITMDNTGKSIIFTGYSMDYEVVGKFGIITADEAFQKILDPNPQFGLMENFRGDGGGGGGSSFYKLNLTGAPIPFPTSTPISNTSIQPSFQNDPAYTPLTATIEKVDLVYYFRNPIHAMLDPRAGIQYMQPTWMFYGHYSNGDEFEILVQALKEEYLLPELAPYTPPG